MGADLQGILAQLQHRRHHLRMDERAVPRQGMAMPPARRAHTPPASPAPSPTGRPSLAAIQRLGSFSTAAPSYEYTVTDADGHQVDVVEMLDGVTLRSYTVTLGQTNTLTIASEGRPLKVVNGSHTLKIVATDAKDAARHLHADFH